MEYNQPTQFSNSNNFNEPAPENNLVWAILSTIFCCLPTGIYAIIKASEVSTKWAAGDKDGARKSADEAKKWSMYGAVASLVLWVLYLIAFGGLAMMTAKYGQ